MGIQNLVQNMREGDKIACRYVAISGVVGAISELGTCVAEPIPVLSSITPDGLFYFIHSGFDVRGRLKLVADRNVQNFLPWDALNTAGLASRTGVQILIPGTTGSKFSLRVLTGGLTPADKDNEWDSIIASSSLNNTVIPGDNSLWNWDGIFSWCSTCVAAPAERAMRGNAAPETHSYVSSAMIAGTIGFRPVLMVENTQSMRHLLQDGDNYKSISLDHLITVATIYNTDTEKATAFKNAPLDIRQFIPLLSELDSLDRKFKVLKRLV